MDAHARRVRDYMSDHGTQPRGYAYEERRPVGYSRCGHLSLVPPAPPLRAVSVILEELKGDDLAQRLLAVRAGREASFLEHEPLVRELVAALACDKDAKATIEAFFDALFADLRTGELFEHSELVMVVLFAIKQAAVTYFREIASVFAESRSSELVHLRRFAISLLAG